MHECRDMCGHLGHYVDSLMRQAVTDKGEREVEALISAVRRVALAGALRAWHCEQHSFLV